MIDRATFLKAVGALAAAAGFRIEPDREEEPDLWGPVLDIEEGPPAEILSEVAKGNGPDDVFGVFYTDDGSVVCPSYGDVHIESLAPEAIARIDLGPRQNLADGDTLTIEWDPRGLFRLG